MSAARTVTSAMGDIQPVRRGGSIRGSGMVARTALEHRPYSYAGADAIEDHWVTAARIRAVVHARQLAAFMKGRTRGQAAP